MKILIACEFSGVVREAFRRKGHSVWSCDLLPAEDESSFHIQGDCCDLLDHNWDMMIAFPPCTHLCCSGARWFKFKKRQQFIALQFVRTLLNANIDKIALENPIGVVSTRIRKPDQIIQPWQFGHGETKSTCLWFKNLPLLTPSKVVGGRKNRVHRLPPSENRWKERSRTLSGIAEAMAEQWT
jgi:hypothetical protein